MNGCLDTEALVGVESALGWKSEGALRHLADCPTCRERLEDLEALYDALAAEVEPAEGFTEKVLRDLHLEGKGEAASRPPLAVPVPAGPAAAGPQRGQPALTLFEALTALLAGLTAFFAIALLSAGAAPVPMGLPVIVASAGAAAGTLWWNRAHRRARPSEGTAP